MASKSKNFRRRVEEDGDGEEEQEDVEEQKKRRQQPLSSGKQAKPNNNNKPGSGATKKQLLSFSVEDEEEEEEENSHRRRLLPSRKQKPSSLVSFETLEVDPSAGGRKKDANRVSASSQKLHVGKEKAANPLSFKADKEETLEENSSLKGRKNGDAILPIQGAFEKKNSGTKDKAGGVAAVPSNFQPQAGEYTKERLMELQKNTIRLGGVPRPSLALAGTESKPKPLSEPIVVLKGSLKPIPITTSIQERVETSLLNGTQQTHAISRASQNIISSKDTVIPEREEEDAEKRLLGSIGIESGGMTQIPDAAAIAAARAKRERLRKAQIAPDYVPIREPLDIRDKLRQAKDANGTKQEASSSDDDDDGGEIHGRVAMAPSDKSRGGVFETTDNRKETTEHGDEERDEEERRWEEEQIRKGFSMRVEDISNRAPIAYPASHPPIGYPPSGIAPSGPLPSAGWGGSGGRIMEVLSISQQADVAMAALREAAQRMADDHVKMKSELQNTEEKLLASLDNVLSLEKSVTAVGEKYVYMQKLQVYISVLCDFLKSKVPLIEELEEHMQRLHEERAMAVSNRRLEDNKDEMEEVNAAISVAMNLLKNGATISTAARESSNASSAIAPPQLDEFGRDVNLQKRMEAKRRAKARDQRRARGSRKRSVSLSSTEDGDAKQHIEGESSSDESDSEEQAFTSGRSEVLQTAQLIFGDAAEEFAQLARVKERLEGWKRMYHSAYRDAYMSLSVPTIFAPYVRLELLQWDPLHEDADFNNMQWHSILFDYGFLGDGGNADPDDLDLDLVPKLVEEVALPILHHEIAHCWDRLSTRGTRNAVSAVQVILSYVPASSEAVQELLVAVRTCLTEAVVALEVPSWNIQVTNAVPQTLRIAAYKFGTSVRLLKNIGLWQDVLAMPILEQLALRELLCGKMLPHLRSLVHTPVDAVTRVERVVAALMGVWIGPNFTASISPMLAPLVEFLMSIGRVVEKRRDAGVSNEDVTRLARRIKRMLVDLNEYDRARLLSKTFQLKEAL